MGLEKWKMIKLVTPISKSCGLAAVSFKGKIFVFGGTLLTGYIMYSFSEEGKML